MDNNQKQNNHSKPWLMILCIFSVLIAIITILLLLLVGKTTVTHSNSNVEEERSLACRTEDVTYPFFTYDNSKKKELEINATFRGNSLASISLIYILTYANNDEAKTSELKNHIDFEVGIQNEGLTYASLNSDHKIMDNVYQLTMYNSREDLNEKNIAKYYLLGSLDDFTQESVKNKLVRNGLNCVNK